MGRTGHEWLNRPGLSISFFFGYAAAFAVPRPSHRASGPHAHLSGVSCPSMANSPKPALLIISGRHLHTLRGVQSAVCTVMDWVQL